MGLFQKKPQVGSSIPLYTVGLQETIIIAGLGNPENEYTGTRHNVGFECVDEFVNKLDFPDFINKKDLKCLFTKQIVNSTNVIVIKPTTYMNNSGEALSALMNFYKVPAEKVIVIHDELDIPFGQIRLRLGGSDAGNNGAKSAIQHIGANFGRVRIGIKNEFSEKADSANFVLGKFTKEEQDLIPALLKETTAILSEIAHGQQLANETRSFII